MGRRVVNLCSQPHDFIDLGWKMMHMLLDDVLLWGFIDCIAFVGVFQFLDSFAFVLLCN